MKRNALWIVAVVAILNTFSCAREEPVRPAAGETEDSPVSGVTDEGFLAGQARVLFSEEMIALIEEDLSRGKIATKSMQLNQAMDELGIKSMHRLFPHAGEFEPRTRREGMHRWYVVEFDEKESVSKAGAEFASIPGVEEFEGCRPVVIADFNDPLLGRQWHYINKGNLTAGAKAGADVNVKPVWDNYTKGSPEVVVAVVDGGIDFEHEDLAWNCDPSRSWNFTNGTSTITPVPHGTHVAGTIGAVNNNGKGVAGLAGGDYAANQRGVTLTSCQIFYVNEQGKTVGSGSGPGAIAWAADHGAVIAQNSWSYSFDYNGNGQIDEGEEMAAALSAKTSYSDRQAIDYFVKYAGCDNNGDQLPDSPMKGGVVFFSAGNDNITNCIPAAYEPCIAVGSFGLSGSKAYYSCYGDYVDIAAPGGNTYDGYTVYSTTPDNSYGQMQGTSMACPHASGVAALVVSYHGGPGFTADMLKERILGGADYSGSIVPLSDRIGPKIDALGAIVYGSSSAPNPVSSYSASAQSNNINFSFKSVTDASGDPAYGYMLYASKSSSALASMNPANPGTGIIKASVLPENISGAGVDLTGTIQGLDFSATYYVTIAAYTYGRTFSEISDIRQVVTGVNSAPEITVNSETDPIEARSHQTLRIPVEISDPDGHDFTISFQGATDGDSFVKDPVTEGRWYFVIEAPKITPGTYAASVTVTDAYSLSNTKELKYKVYANVAPKKVRDIDNIYAEIKGYTVTLNLDDYFTDPDGETLRYEFTYTNSSVAYFNPNGNTLYGTVLSYGRTEVTVTAYDAKNLNVTTSFILVARSPKVQMETYPSPVTTTLNISTGKEKKHTAIAVYSSSGAVVYSGTQTTSAFLPGKVNMKDCAPGIYTAVVEYGGKEYRETFYKK